MAIRIFLVEDLTSTLNWVELDTGVYDTTVIYSVTDISNITAKNDTLTKHLQFPGTKTNENAFGYFFNTSRVSDFKLVNRMGANMNQLRPVTCVILEDSERLMVGSMRIYDYDAKTRIYDVVVTGSWIDFKQELADKMLTDLNFDDLAHIYIYDTIKKSWSTSTQRWDKTANGGLGNYTTVPFSKGSGYVYPFIDYGNTFKNVNYNAPRHVNYIKVTEFRPAIYGKEIFDRIWAQIPGFSYEVRGESDLLDKWNSWIIPNCEEIMENYDSTKNFRVKRSASYTGAIGISGSWDGSKKGDWVFDLDQGLAPGPLFDLNMINYYGSYRGATHGVFKVDRNFTAEGLISVKLSLQNHSIYPQTAKIQLCERDWIEATVPVPLGGTVDNPKFNDGSTWEPICSKDIKINSLQSLPSQLIEFETGEHKFQEGKQICLRILCDGLLILANPILSFTIDAASVTFPKDLPNPNYPNAGKIKYDIKYKDKITPKVPENVKQLDFIRSVMTMFNFVVYTEPSNPKHLIFEPWDYFYRFCQPDTMILPGVAVDWTRKIDLSQAMKINSNIDLPKSYLFTYKSDSDLINKDFTEKNPGRIYGQKDVTDKYGMIDQKKVEVIFSPSPTVEYVAGSDRKHPSILQRDGNTVKPIKSNTRIVFYNSMLPCSKATIAHDDYRLMVDPADNKLKYMWDIVTIDPSFDMYPSCGEYYCQPITGLPLDVLQFGVPDRYYFGNTTPYENTTNVYNSRFRTQVTELTNENMITLDCYAWLTEEDVSSVLPLNVPVFIDLGEAGEYSNAYYKILKMEYNNRETPTKLLLQKIPYNIDL